ncbi:undecaprenyl-diphosphatase [Caballeronia sordidicola]|uniref:undecaprenyl-diphosphatase n=1 Tax=Caballeronia sordidicola TaxID=196367 RepID=UPI00094C9355|nr:undecaprenyl-diphosphatase [Caballeronia sordidicola]
MDAFNHTLFLLVNASPDASQVTIWIADVFAMYAIWAAPLALIVGWLRGDENLRHTMVEAALSTGVALLAAQIIGVVWPQPRPFMIGLGTHFMARSPDPTFPSDHLTCLWGASLSLLLHRRTRPTGIALSLLGMPMAWSRIYLGVHFPMDIAGAAMVSALSAWIVARAGRRPVDLTLVVASRVYRMMFRSLIRRGWVSR